MNTSLFSVNSQQHELLDISLESNGFLNCLRKRTEPDEYTDLTFEVMDLECKLSEEQIGSSETTNDYEEIDWRELSQEISTKPTFLTFNEAENELYFKNSAGQWKLIDDSLEKYDRDVAFELLYQAIRDNFTSIRAMSKST